MLCAARTTKDSAGTSVPLLGLRMKSRSPPKFCIQGDQHNFVNEVHKNCDHYDYNSSDASDLSVFTSDIDHLHIMTRRENTTYKCEIDFLQGDDCCCENHHSQEDCDDNVCSCRLLWNKIVLLRTKLCGWCYRIVDHFNVDRRVVALAFAYLDRYTSSLDQPLSHKIFDDYPLLITTTLHMASKMSSYSSNNNEISMEALVMLSREKYTVQHLMETECMILSILEWKLCPPIPQEFCDEIMRFLLPETSLQQRSYIYQHSLFFCELAIFDVYLVSVPRSTVAVAAMINAMMNCSYRTTCNALATSHRCNYLDFLDNLFDKVDFLHISRLHLDTIRKRLQYLFSECEQYHHDIIGKYKEEKREFQCFDHASCSASTCTDNSCTSGNDSLCLAPKDQNKKAKEEPQHLRNARSPVNVCARWLRYTY